MGSKGVAIFGLGLVAANTFTSGAGGHIKSAIIGQAGPEAHTAFVLTIGQVLVVLVLAFIADASPDMGAVIVALLLGLWLVWAVANANQITKAAQALGVK